MSTSPCPPARVAARRTSSWSATSTCCVTTNTIPQIVAVTFTEAAAAEMRQRVRREVMQRPELEHHRPHVDDGRHWHESTRSASACCASHPVEAALDPGAEVLADDEAELLRQVAGRRGDRRGR